MRSAFLSQVISFFVIAITLFLIARAYGWLTQDSVIKFTVKCKYCRKRISEKASCGWDATVEPILLIDAVGEEMCQLYKLARWERRIKSLQVP